MKPVYSQEVQRLPLGLLHLPNRGHNALEKAGIKTLGDLLSLSDAELSAVPNLGPTNLKIIRERKDTLLDSMDESGHLNWFYFWESQGIRERVAKVSVPQPQTNRRDWKKIRRERVCACLC